MDSTVLDLERLSLDGNDEGVESNQIKDDERREKDVLEDMLIAGMEEEEEESDEVTSSEEELGTEEEEEESEEDFDVGEIEIPSQDPMAIVEGVFPLLPPSVPIVITTPPPPNPSSSSLPLAQQQDQTPPQPKPTVSAVVVLPSPTNSPPPSHSTRTTPPSLPSALKTRAVLTASTTTETLPKKSVRFNPTSLQAVCVFKRATAPSDIITSPRFTLEDTEEDLRPPPSVIYRPTIVCRNFPASGLGVGGFNIGGGVKDGREVRVEKVHLDGRTLVGLVR
ncbi:hypothetical protein HK097_006893, partial [Rhizophlyctis rosea]